MRVPLHLLASVAALTTGLASPAAAEPVDAAEALERLKALEGTWRGPVSGEGEAEAEATAVEEVVHEFRVAAAGTVVMETMSPGGEGEMINMYHLDGDDLVLTHYCAGGNQPRMRLDLAASDDDRLVFDFDGGTNLAAGDHHIHDATLTFDGADRLDSLWTAYAGEEQIGVMRFHLSRQ